MKKGVLPSPRVQLLSKGKEERGRELTEVETGATESENHDTTENLRKERDVSFLPFPPEENTQRSRVAGGGL